MPIIMQQQFESTPNPRLISDGLSGNTVLSVGSTLCQANCSGNGECIDGSCYCMIRYDGDDCRNINFSYHVAFASIFFLLALTSLIQLAMCIHAEYLRMKKHPSILRACRITTQKFLYFAVFLAALLRGTYFAAPTVGSELSTSLLSAYYPVVLTSASLVVCFWAEVFHLREVRWDRPRFLSKSFLGFVAFNIISYAILIAELLMVWIPSTPDEGISKETTKIRDEDRREFYAHIFNGCYAVLMFVVVIFFLIYGVEVFFKVRGGFAVSKVPNVIRSSGITTSDRVTFLDPDEVARRRRLRKQQRRRERSQNSMSDMCNTRELNVEANAEDLKSEQDTEDSPLHSLMNSLNISKEENYTKNKITSINLNHNCQIETNDLHDDSETRKALLTDSSQVNQGDVIELPQFSMNIGNRRLSRGENRNIYVIQSSSKHENSNSMSRNAPEEAICQEKIYDSTAAGSNVKTSNPSGRDMRFDQLVNTSQLHQSRLGLLSQALMMIITVGFLFSETLEEFWKTKVDLTSRNTHDIIFRTIEIGVALWFPCVLWNCIRPEQLWCLNPKKILDRGRKFKSQFNSEKKRNVDNGDAKQPDKSDEMPNLDPSNRDSRETSTDFSTTDDDEERILECWICYDTDRTDAGPMINPCECRGDVSAVHHDCLQRWLMERPDDSDALKCKVCEGAYMVEKGSEFSLSKGFTAKQWLQTASYVTIMCLSVGGSWAVIQLYSQAWIRTLAVGAALFVLYLCLRSLGLNTVSAYQRAKVSALRILGRRRTNNVNKNQQEIDGGEPNQANESTPAERNINKIPPKPGQEEILSPVSVDRTRLSMDHIEPIHPSNIIKNYHKTRI